MTKHRGFTLIELLVVIAIIAILAAILFPVYARLKDKARMTQCISNMKQLTVATVTYTDDSDGKLPLWWFKDGNYSWAQAIMPYVKNQGIFTCPSNSKLSSGTATEVIRSYAMPRNISSMALSQIRNVASTVLYFEKGSARISARSDATGESFMQTWGAGETMPGLPADTYWHGKGKVFAFVDGHAKFWNSGTGPFAYAFSDAYQSFGLQHPGYCGGRVYMSTNDEAMDPGCNLPP